MFENLHEAHMELVKQTALASKPGYDPIPVSLVSVDEGTEGQLVIFDENKVAAASVVKRLRAAAAHIEQAIKLKSEINPHG